MMIIALFNERTIHWVPIGLGLLTLVYLLTRARLPDPDALNAPTRPPAGSTDYKELKRYLRYRESYLRAWLDHRETDAEQRKKIETALRSTLSTLGHHPLNDDLAREIDRIENEVIPVLTRVPHQEVDGDVEAASNPAEA